jgi:trk system potassium uptake protein TrkH
MDGTGDEGRALQRHAAALEPRSGQIARLAMSRATAVPHNSGQAAVALRVRPRFVGRAFLRQTPVLAVVVAAPALAAMAEKEQALATALFVPTLALVALGVWSRRVPLTDDLRRIEAVVTLVLVFLASAAVTIPAFMTLGMGGLAAFFEGISGITTTGLSVARDAESWPVSAHFLRAWLQWCGGVVVAVAGVALLMDAGRAARVMGQESLGGADYHASTRAKARVVLAGYGALTLLGIVLSVPLFPGLWEGPLIVLAAVSTGGFSPRDNSLADYTLAAQVFTLALCAATSVSLLFYPLVRERGLRLALRRGTVRLTLVVVLAGAAGHAVLHGIVHGWDRAGIVAGVLNQVSAQTTAGFSTAPVLPASPVLILMVAAMMIGGDVGSTTGGIKIPRIAMLARMVDLILLRLRLPDRAVSHLKIGRKRADADSILLAAGLLGIYLVAMMIFWLVLFASGYPALAALFDVVSALSGVGLSAGVVGPDLPAPLMAMTILAMLLGRLEFFVVIALVLPSTWISRR